MPKNPTFRQVANSAAGRAAGLKAPKPPDSAEERFQEASALFISWLREEGWLIYPYLVRHNGQENSSAYWTKKMSTMGVIPGAPDWSMGVKVAVELKVLGRGLSKDQKKYRDQWKKDGGFYMVCRSMARFAELLLHHAAHPQPGSTPVRAGVTFETAVKELAKKARRQIEMTKGPVP